MLRRRSVGDVLWHSLIDDKQWFLWRWFNLPQKTLVPLTPYVLGDLQGARYYAYFISCWFTGKFWFVYELTAYNTWPTSPCTNQGLLIMKLFCWIKSMCSLPSSVKLFSRCHLAYSIWARHMGVLVSTASPDLPQRALPYTKEVKKRGDTALPPGPEPMLSLTRYWW